MTAQTLKLLQPFQQPDGTMPKKLEKWRDVATTTNRSEDIVYDDDSLICAVNKKRSNCYMTFLLYL